MSERPEPLVLFTDRDLGKRFPEILAAVGLTVERHADHFAHDCPDDVWLKEIGGRGWIAVTHDRNIRYKANERAAVMRHGVRLLVVVGKAPHPQLAASFVHTYPKIVAFAAGHAAPWIAKVYRRMHRRSLGNRARRDRLFSGIPKALGVLDAKFNGGELEHSARSEAPLLACGFDVHQHRASADAIFQEADSDSVA